MIIRQSDTLKDKGLGVRAGVYQLCDVFRPTDPLGPAVAEAKEQVKKQHEGVIPLAECRIV